jgi:hypothetical protein
MGEFAIGQGVPRFEDPRLLRGGGRYVDDLAPPGMLFGYVLRSPHALPRSGTKRPWNVRQNYFADALDYRFDRIEESMVFGRAAESKPLAG